MSGNNTYIHYCEHKVFLQFHYRAVVAEERDVPLGEGDVSNVPPAEHHQSANRGDEVFRFLMEPPIPQRTALKVSFGMRQRFSLAA